MTFIDLHTHSTASDGTDSPAELVRKAAQAHLAALALTDHDTLAGLKEAKEEAKLQNIAFVRGCEISTVTPWGEAHFLGLWIPESGEKTAQLEYALEDIRNGRKERNFRIAEKLRKLGLDISYESVDALAGGSVVGRPHFAAMLCSMGVVKNMREAFRQYLGRGGLAYEPRRLMSPEDCVSLLKSTGAVVSMAHPRLLHAPDNALERMVAGLKERGLDALEAYHSEHTAGDVRMCVDFAARYALQLSGGSDYHGLAKPNIRLGRCRGERIDFAVYDALMRYRKKRDEI